MSLSHRLLGERILQSPFWPSFGNYFKVLTLPDSLGHFLCPREIDNSQQPSPNRALRVDSSVYVALYKQKGSGQDAFWLVTITTMKH